jgi:AFG3 family protein
MVTQFGMSDVIGYVGIEQEGYIHQYSEKTATNIDKEIIKIVKDAEQKCRALVKEKANLIEE